MSTQHGPDAREWLVVCPNGTYGPVDKAEAIRWATRNDECCPDCAPHVVKHESELPA